MVATTKEPLGATTTNRKWYLDVWDETSSAYIGVFGVMEFQDAREATMQDDSDFDSEGYRSSTKTAEAWSVVCKVRRGVLSDNQQAYDPGQEILRIKAQGKMGPANTVKIRYYEMEPSGPREEAHEGLAAVQWAPDGGPMDALSTVTVTLTGQGKLDDITHPDTSGLPSVAGVDPTTGDVAGGDLVSIFGNGFSGATDVKFGTDSAASFEVVSDNTIVAVSPAVSASTVHVTVITAAGTSATSAADQFTFEA